MLRFPTTRDILTIHQNQIEKYGGSTGIRDMELLKSALAVPQATFNGQYLHSSIYEMSAAHCFKSSVFGR